MIDMLIFEKNPTSEDVPNTWRRLIDGKNISASIFCSKGHYGVVTDHTINDDGIVNPSVVCPEEGCTFHDMIKLKDWNEK
jgi:hypothetical protein